MSGSSASLPTWRRVIRAHYRDVALGVQSLRTQIIDDAGQLLVMLLVAVGLLLVLGSANVANLLMVRNRRQRLMVATRAALGGSRATIVRWLLSELLLLGGLAAAAGSGLAAMLAPSLLRITQIVGPGMDASVVDPRTLAFTTLITLVASLTVGIVPALRAARLDLASVLRVGGARTSDGAASEALAGAVNRQSGRHGCSARGHRRPDPRRATPPECGG